MSCVCIFIYIYVSNFQVKFVETMPDVQAQVNDFVVKLRKRLVNLCL